ncbi:MAG: type II toxin-antitoxin system Phd/YefM family antitoxin [Roseimicrobium sp.]
MKVAKKSEWQLQTAKNRLSEVVNRALTEGVQTITRHGKPVVVVLSQEDFLSLAAKEEKEEKWSMLAHLRACPDKTLHKRIFKTPGPPRLVDFE